MCLLTVRVLLRVHVDVFVNVLLVGRDWGRLEAWR